MRLSKVSLFSIASISAIGMIVWAEESTSERLKSDQKQGLIALLVREAKLSSDQEASLKEKQKDMFKTLAQWDKTHELQFARLDAEIVEASANGKTQELEDLKKERNDLKQQREEKVQSLTGNMMGVLTADQRAMWDGYKMFPEILAKFKAVKLTEDQYAKIRELCTAAAKLETEALKKGESTTPIREGLIADIKKHVLTPEQIDKMTGATTLTQAPTSQPKAPTIVGINTDPIRDMAGDAKGGDGTPSPIYIGGTGRHTRSYRRR